MGDEFSFFTRPILLCIHMRMSTLHTHHQTTKYANQSSMRIMQPKLTAWLSRAPRAFEVWYRSRHALFTVKPCPNSCFLRRAGLVQLDLTLLALGYCICIGLKLVSVDHEFRKGI